MPFPSDTGLKQAVCQPALLLCWALLLTACTSLPPSSVIPDLQVHEQKLRQLSSWQLRGNLIIRSEEVSRRVNLLWEQKQQAFYINLSGTLGLGTITLTGDETGLLMEQSGEPPYRAESLAEVSGDWLGYDYPAEHLLYWVRGLPAPDSPFMSSQNEQGLLADLDQDGWTVTYDRYSSVGEVWLPERIQLQNARFRLVIQISEWEWIE